jgi:hypothetical protein
VAVACYQLAHHVLVDLRLPERDALVAQQLLDNVASVLAETVPDDEMDDGRYRDVTEAMALFDQAAREMHVDPTGDRLLRELATRVRAKDEEMRQLTRLYCDHVLKDAKT